MLRYAAASVILSAFCALFGAVYEYFSHEVYSYFMIYAVALPLLLCGLPYILFAVNGKNIPPLNVLRLWNSGISTLTVGCIFEGVLEIYGTTNRLIIVYPIAGSVLCTAAVILYVVSMKKHHSPVITTGEIV